MANTILSIDIIKYLGCLIGILLSAKYVRRLTGTRFYLTSALVSLVSAVICFGISSISIVLTPVLITCVYMYVLPRRLVGNATMVTLMVNLMYHHWITHNTTWSLDYTGVLMMLTLRLIGLSYDWSDSIVMGIRHETLIGFALYPPVFLTGPPLKYTEWLENVSRVAPVPITTRHIITLVVMSGIHILGVSSVPPVSPIGIAQLALSTRAKYYVGWTLAEMIAAQYHHHITINNVAGVETSVHVRDVLGSWNIGTSEWLRTYVYGRLPRTLSSDVRSLITMLFSGVWHGFHLGGVLAFTMMSLLGIVSKHIYVDIRPRVNTTVYSIVMGLFTHLVMDYTMISFIIRDLSSLFTLYTTTWWYGYVLLGVGYLISYLSIWIKSKSALCLGSVSLPVH